MLKKILRIMWHDRRTGMFRIVRKSYARYRRFGYRNMRRKLEREYFALFPGEVRYRERQRLYRRWRRHREKARRRVPAVSQDLRMTVLLRVQASDPLRYVRTALQSILKQTYASWELLIWISPEVSREIRNYLREALGDLAQVRWFEGAEIPVGTITSVRGEYVLMLSASDRLAPFALEAFADAVLRTSPSPRLLYSDDDRIDGGGERHTPHFKCDWNPDLFLSGNYLGKAWCMERSLLRSVWGEKGFPGTYRLLLRAVKRLDEERIAHLRQILFHHRREADDSGFVGWGEDEEEEACEALREYFADFGGVRVEAGAIPGSCRVFYPLPDPLPKVSIIVPTRDRYDLLFRCIESILEKTRYPRYEILIVDNQSRERSAVEYMRRLEERYGHIRILAYDRPFNYSAINNYAVSRSDGEVVALLNNDVEIISEGWLDEMVRHALRPEIGAVGAKLYYDNLTVQHAGVILGLGDVAGHGHKYFAKESKGYFGRLQMVQNYSAVTGACLVVRREAYEAVGGLEERYLSVAFNDVDFCLKLTERGYRNLWTPYAELYHHESRSRGTDDTPEKQARFEAEVAYMLYRWHRRLTRDPYYSPHLSRFFEDFRIEIYWKERKRLERRAQKIRREFAAVVSEESG